MTKPIVMGIMGMPKTGKTKFAVDTFTSAHLDPTKVLYVDNHDSTISYNNLPEFSKKTSSGLFHAKTWDALPALLLEIERKQARLGSGEPLLDMLVLDDLTEQSALSIENLSGEVGMNMGKWGQHKTFMSVLYRKIKAVSKNVIFVVRCDWKGDPNEKPNPSEVGDMREQKMQPILEGAFNGWFRYDVALLAYHEKEVRGSGKVRFTQRLQPTADVMVENRLWFGEPSKIEDPSFDKLFELIHSKEGE